VAAVGTEVAQDPIQGFCRLEIQLALQLHQGVFALVGHDHLQPGLEIQESRGSLLAGFDAGLVVGVHIDELAIEADGPFKEGDQRPQAVGVEALHGDAQVEAPFLGQGGAGALQESIQEVPRVLPLEGRDITGILQDLHKGHEEVVHAITQLLDVGVLIG